jgi:RasGEF domain
VVCLFVFFWADFSRQFATCDGLLCVGVCFCLFFQRFLNVAHACLQLRNYNSAGLLMSALESEELSLLQATWNLVSHSSETQKKFEELKKVSANLRDRSQFFSAVVGVRCLVLFVRCVAATLLSGVFSLSFFLSLFLLPLLLSCFLSLSLVVH